MLSLIEFFGLFEEKKISEFKFSENFIKKEIDKKDFEIYGMIYELITNVKYRRFFDDELLTKISNSFLPFYFIECIKNNPSSDWADSSYSAAWNAVGWFQKMDNAGNSKVLNDFVNQLEKLYNYGNINIKKVIEVGFLEHVFDKPKLRKYFNQSMGCAAEPGRSFK